MRRQPTAAEVVGRLKDDGDFDALRRTIIRKVKDNEVLRNNIITEVRQSMVINEDGSEKLKLKDLSDAIYQDIGNKIMGQISDELWSVIQSNETDIQGTVEAVYIRMMNPDWQQDTGRSSKKLKRNAREEQIFPANASPSVAVLLEDDDPEEPPGFGFSEQHNIIATQQWPSNTNNHNQVKPNEVLLPVSERQDAFEAHRLLLGNANANLHLLQNWDESAVPSTTAKNQNKVLSERKPVHPRVVRMEWLRIVKQETETGLPVAIGRA
ncbi:hypothetical protein GUJ93_ZPchr0006g44693 [Zizania palustris]|uniref:Uncharacterized protein n=1 Tax=Zizania palustris TaxID=103762 RepID=A0A8J5SG16_ZIZPA|nr:hypothetical protein GUJ93_ZPchr0006g44693 [Zizania palustris]